MCSSFKRRSLHLLKGVTAGRRPTASGPFCFRYLRPTRDGGAIDSYFFSFLFASSDLRSPPGRFSPPDGAWPILLLVVRERERGGCVMLCVGFGFDRFWGSWVGVTVCIWNIGILADDCCRLPYNSSSRKWVSAFGCFHSWWSCCKEVFKSEWGHEGNECSWSGT